MPARVTDDTLLHWAWRVGVGVLGAVGGWKFVANVLLPWVDDFLAAGRSRKPEAFDRDVMASLKRCEPAVSKFLRDDVFPEEIEKSAINETITREIGARMSGLSSAVNAQADELRQLAAKTDQIPQLQVLFEQTIKGTRRTNRMLQKLDASQNQTAINVAALTATVERVVHEFDSDRSERRNQSAENQRRRAEWPAAHQTEEPA